MYRKDTLSIGKQAAAIGTAINEGFTGMDDVIVVLFGFFVVRLCQPGRPESWFVIEPGMSRCLD